MPHYHGAKANNGGLPQLGDLALVCNMLGYLFVIYILTKSPILCSRAPLLLSRSFIPTVYVQHLQYYIRDLAALIPETDYKGSCLLDYEFCTLCVYVCMLRSLCIHDR